MITYVYAQDEKGGIGYNNDIPEWNLPNDLKFFKEHTMGHTMLMGRATFESMDCRLLPGRKTVVMTTNKEYGKDIEGLELIHSVEEGLKLASDQEVMCIGGAGVFESFAPHVDRILRTMVEGEFPADTFVPDINKDEFELVKVEDGVLDERNKHPHRFEFWERKK